MNPKKWSNLEPDHLFLDILQNLGEMLKAFTLKDIQTTSKTLERHTGQQWYSYKLSKCENINNIVAAFDSKEFLDPVTTTCLIQTPRSLVFLSKSVLKQNNYPGVCMKFAIATGIHTYEKCLWNGRRYVEEYSHIPNEDSPEVDTVMEFFSIPEYSKQRNQLEFRTLDYTHMLTNMRSHILSRGYDFCPTQHYHTLAEEMPDIVSRAIIFDQADTQSAFYALHMFSKEVEEFFIAKGHTDSAHFVKLVRDGHEACDLHGLPADEQV